MIDLGEEYITHAELAIRAAEILKAVVDVSTHHNQGHKDALTPTVPRRN